MTLGDFEFNEAGTQVVQCPAGQVPVEHKAHHAGRVMLAVFSLAQCLGCALRQVCPTQTRNKGTKRVLSFAADEVAVARRRVEQETPDFKERHKLRSGIEATNSELKRCHGLRKPRVRLRPRVTLSVRLKTLALNIKRYVTHLADVAASAAAPAPACACACAC